jgi:hypothetical protein
MVERPQNYHNQPKNGQKKKLRADRCGCPQAAGKEEQAALLSLIRFLSLRLKPKAAATPKRGSGPGTRSA